MILNILATTVGLILGAKLISLPFLVLGRAAYSLSTLAVFTIGAITFAFKHPADGIGVIIFMAIILSFLFLIGRASSVAPQNANDHGCKTR
jgi:hypothetical protein